MFFGVPGFGSLKGEGEGEGEGEGVVSKKKGGRKGVIGKSIFFFFFLICILLFCKDKSSYLKLITNIFISSINNT